MARAVATLLWCAAVAWLVARPSAAVAAMMRRPAGRLTLLASWLSSPDERTSKARPGCPTWATLTCATLPMTGMTTAV
jgi:hypothetical protein